MNTISEECNINKSKISENCMSYSNNDNEDHYDDDDDDESETDEEDKLKEQQLLQMLKGIQKKVMYLRKKYNIF